MNPLKASSARSRSQTCRAAHRRRKPREEWTQLGAEFLRAVTSGATVTDDSFELPGMHGFRLARLRA